MADIDRRTGAIIDNYASALQSVEIIFATRIGERVMLREFGAGLTELLGRKLVPSLLSAFVTLVIASIDTWEPRFRVRRIEFGGSVEELRLGKSRLSIEVEWRPRAHLGDDSVEGIRTFGLRYLNGEAITE